MNELSSLRREHSDIAGGKAVRLSRPSVRWKTRVLLPALLLAATAGLLLYAAGDVLNPAVAVQVVAVVVKEGSAGPRAGGVVAMAPGWVEPDPYAINVPVLADGVVREVLVLEGQRVRAGQTLIRLVDDDAKLALARAEAALAEVRAELRAAELNAGVAPAGPALPIAQAEVRRELDRLPSQIAAARSRLAELTQDAEAKERAAERGVVASVAASMARARAEGARSELASLTALEPVLQARLELIGVQTEQALGRARASVTAAKAARDEAALRLSRMQIISPIDGKVLMRDIEPGLAVTAAGKPPIRLYSPEKLQIRVDVPLVNAARVRVGMDAEVVIDVLPDCTFTGRVTREVDEADIQRNTIQFKVEIHEPTEQVKPEMIGRVRFIAAATPASAGPTTAVRLFAPASAVPGQAGQTVDVLIADPTRNVALARRVTLGGRHEDHVEIVDGLLPGDRLIVSPGGLKDGQRIRIMAGQRADAASKGDPHGNH